MFRSLFTCTGPCLRLFSHIQVSFRYAKVTCFHHVVFSHMNVSFHIWMCVSFHIWMCLFTSEGHFAHVQVSFHIWRSLFGCKGLFPYKKVIWHVFIIQHLMTIFFFLGTRIHVSFRYAKVTCFHHPAFSPFLLTVFAQHTSPSTPRKRKKLKIKNKKFKINWHEDPRKVKASKSMFAFCWQERWGAGVEYHFQEISWNLRPVVNGT